jgi:hypothetical protein
MAAVLTGSTVLYPEESCGLGKQGCKLNFPKLGCRHRVLWAAVGRLTAATLPVYLIVKEVSGGSVRVDVWSEECA